MPKLTVKISADESGRPTIIELKGYKVQLNYDAKGLIYSIDFIGRIPSIPDVLDAILTLTKKNEEVPRAASSTLTGVLNPLVGNGKEQTIKLVNGVGYVEYLFILVQPAVDAQKVNIKIYCDGIIAFDWTFSTLAGSGLDKTTAPIMLLQYADDGRCQVMLTLPFHFRKQLVINLTSPVVDQVCTTDGLVNLLS